MRFQSCFMNYVLVAIIIDQKSKNMLYNYSFFYLLLHKQICKKPLSKTFALLITVKIYLTFFLGF
jgi:hypothetical protein